MAELVLRLRVAGNQEVQNALQALGQQAANVQAKVMHSGQGADRASLDFRRMGAAASNVGALLSGTAAIASTFARGNKELQERLQSFSLVTASGSAVVRTFGAALSLVGKGPIGLIILGLGAAVTATVFLVRHWEQAKESALRIWGAVRDFFVRVFEGISTTFRGLGQIIVGVFRRDMGQIEAGSELLREGLGQLKDTAVDLGVGIKNLAVAGWEKISGLFEQTGAKGKLTAAELARLQEAIAETDFQNLQDDIQRNTIPVMQRLAATLRLVVLEARDYPRVLREIAKDTEDLWKRLAPLFDLSRFRPRGQGSPFEELLPDPGTIAALKEALEGPAMREAWERFAQGGIDVSRELAQRGGVEGAIVYLQSWRDALQAAGQLTDEAAERINAGLIELFGRLGKESGDASEAVRSQWMRSIGDMLTGAQSFSEAMTAIFESIKNTIIRKIGEAFADKVWDWAKGLKLSKILPFPFNIIAGFIGLEHGGRFITQGPTPIMVGEGHERELVEVTPLSKLSRGGGTTIINVNIPPGTNFLGSKEDVRRWFEAVAGPVLREQYAR